MRYIKIGHSKYLSLSRLEKLNRKSNDFKYLKNFYKYLEKELIRLKEGKPKKNHSQQWLDNIDILDEIRITSTLDPEIYYRIQNTLLNITGRLWPMDELLDHLLTWFIFVYADPRQPYKIMPFIKKEQKNINLIKFKDRFEKHYKNIMKSWEHNI